MYDFQKLVNDMLCKTKGLIRIRENNLDPEEFWSEMLLNKFAKLAGTSHESYKEDDFWESLH